MKLPVVAIVGRPNVGKSSLLNRMAGRRISIVDPTPGVTRDRVSAICSHDETYFELVDTGGWGIIDETLLKEQIEEQILFVIREADLVLFVLDAVVGITPLDQEVARLLRQHNRKVVPLANKIDAEPQNPLSVDIFRLGFGEAMRISALHGRGMDALLERVAGELFGVQPQAVPQEPAMHFAIVGKRNVGKSSFVNALAQQPRVIVNELPGTTRDAVDVRFEKDGRVYVAIDTAGVHKKVKTAGDIEYYGYTRVLRSIRRCDVVLFLIDAEQPVGQVEKKLSRYVIDQFKPVVLVVNKWDLTEGRANKEQYRDYLTKLMPQLSYVPVETTTATEGRSLQRTIDTAMRLHKQASIRVTTGPLNEVIEGIKSLPGPSAPHGAKRPRMFYATQVAVCPPTIVFFVNDPSAIAADYERFLINRLREQLPFAEVPIRLVLRSRRAAKQPALDEGMPVA